jgi:16S rRNA (uracil1498-N3)-methyltransferase
MPIANCRLPIENAKRATRSFMGKLSKEFPRFHVPGLVAPTVELPQGEAHHALNVLRLRVGAEVELFDGLGRSAAGKLAVATRGRVVVGIERVEGPAPRPTPIVHLAFAVPKGKRLDWLLEKATELGAASLQPVVFHRGVAGGGELTDAKRERWLSHCVAAAKQCGLDFLPEIRPLVGCAVLSAAHRLPSGASGVQQSRRGDLHTLPLRLVGDSRPDAATFVDALRAEAGPGAPVGEVLILVGPEGGLTDDERRAAIEAGFIRVRLGATTLRTETAAVALLAATIGLLEQRHDL